MKRRTLVLRAIIASALWPLMQASARACPICFQIENGHAAGGVRAGVVVLVGVTTAVVGGCVAFFTRIWQRQ